MVRHDQDRVIRLGASVVIFVTMSLLALDLLGGKAAFGQEPNQICPGDANCDGLRDFGDINVFVATLGGAQPCKFANVDTNGDGLLNFADINPFVALIGTDCPDPNEPNEPPHADFQILEFLGGDLNDPNCYKRWDDPNDPNVVAGPIEYGLRVTLDASLSGGEDWYLYRWEFGDGMYQYVEGTPLFTRVFTDDRPINLKVYTKDRGKSASVKKTLRVKQEFRYLGSTVQPGEPFYPHVACQSGEFVWAISSLNKLGVVRLGDANGGEPLQLIACEALQSPGAMVAYSGYLYIANRGSGVPIYAADPSRWVLAGRIVPADMGNDYADHVSVVGDALYVGSDATRRIWVFDLASPSGPKAVKFVQAPGAIDAIGGPGRDYVIATIARTYAWVLDAVDTKNPKALPLLTIPDSYGTVAASSNAAGVGLNRLTGAQLVQIGRTYDEYGRVRSISAGLAQRVPTGTEFFACSQTRLYAPVSAGGVYKYDIANPDDVYCMGKAELNTRDVWATLMFRRASDGATRVLVGCDPVGFLIYHP